MTRFTDDLPPELRDVAELLDRERPQPSALELDRAKRRAMARGSRTTHPKGSFMRSRLAIVATLATGLVMSGGGAALGISALTSTDSASIAQYGPPQPQNPVLQPPPSGGELPDAPPDQVPPPGRGGVLGEEEAGGGGDTVARPEAQPVQPAQPLRQVQTTTPGSLPFTGYASIPLVLVGLGLLATGLVLRRTTRDDASA